MGGIHQEKSPYQAFKASAVNGQSFSHIQAQLLDIFSFFCGNSLRLSVGAPLTQLGMALHHSERC